MRPEPLDDFDQIERLTRRVGRGALVGFPVWIVLLALLPLTGMGVLACLTGATALAVAAVIVAERRRNRRLAAREAVGGGPGEPPLRRGERRPMSPLTAVALTLGAVALLAYVVLVIQAS
jgi:hypothetical protein